MIGEVLDDHGIEIERAFAYRSPVPNSMDPYAALVVMGGPMAVYESGRYPHLEDEIRLIRHALAESKPVLGVCLGSQLLAAALGAVVEPARKELGWHSIALTEAAERDPLWKGIESPLEVFHWHGDAFGLPPGARHLASSSVTPHQAFAHATNAYGLLFHMEMDEAMIAALVDRFAQELAPLGMDQGMIFSKVGTSLPEMRRVGKIVFDRWVGLIR